MSKYMRLLGMALILFACMGCGPTRCGTFFPWDDSVEYESVPWTVLPRLEPKVEEPVISEDQEWPPLTPEEKWGKLLPPPKGLEPRVAGIPSDQK